MAKLKNRVGANNQRVEHVENGTRREIRDHVPSYIIDLRKRSNVRLRR